MGQENEVLLAPLFLYAGVQKGARSALCGVLVTHRKRTRCVARFRVREGVARLKKLTFPLRFRPPHHR